MTLFLETASSRRGIAAFTLPSDFSLLLLLLSFCAFAGTCVLLIAAVDVLVLPARLRMSFPILSTCDCN
jgi:hypothetical protein